MVNLEPNTHLVNSQIAKRGCFGLRSLRRLHIDRLLIFLMIWEIIDIMGGERVSDKYEYLVSRVVQSCFDPTGHCKHSTSECISFKEQLGMK